MKYSHIIEMIFKILMDNRLGIYYTLASSQEFAGDEGLELSRENLIRQVFTHLFGVILFDDFLALVIKTIH